MSDSEHQKPPSNLSAGKKTNKARKSFPKAGKTPNSTNSLVSVNNNSNEGNTELAPENSPLIPSESSNVSIQVTQKNLLAEMRKRYMSPALPSQTTGPEVSLQPEIQGESTIIPKTDDFISVESPKSSDDKRADTAAFDGINQPPTPASTPLKEDELNIEAAMAALHGEILEESFNINSAKKTKGDDSKLKRQSQPSTKEDKISPEPSVQVAHIETPVGKQPVRVTVSETKKETSQTLEDTIPSNKAPKRSRVSRELENLRIDEGAIKILDEMKDKAKRRSTRPCMGSGYVSSQDMSVCSSPRQRPELKHDSDSEKKMKKPRTIQPPAKRPDEDEALENWQVMPILSSKKKLLYTPRHYPVLLDGQQEPEKFISSESDVGDTPVPKKKKRVALTLPDQSIEEFKEILLTYKERFLHVVISPVSTTLHNSFNFRVLKELTSLLRKLKTDTKTKVVLITSAGSDFCKGIDLPSIIHNNDDTLRLNVINETVNCIRDFFLELANCKKYLVGGLHGRVIGIGVAMLPYFDVTYAADKTVFHLPYAALGQCTEGASGYACRVTSKGTQAFSLMLSESRKLTADQAHQMGLISSVLGLASFNEALMPLVTAIASQSSEALLTSKQFMQHSAWLDLRTVLESECNQLLIDWSSSEFVIQAEKFLDQDFMA